jgi:TRAP-type mannitol/chloroaromatic compound transport system permease small subunit
MYKQYPKMVQLWFDAILYLFVFIPLFIILIIYSASYALDSGRYGRSPTSDTGSHPFILQDCHARGVHPDAPQGISELIKIVALLIKGGESGMSPEHWQSRCSPVFWWRC